LAAALGFLTQRILAPIAALALFLMMALTIVEVVGRYFLALPVTGGEEIKAFLLGFTVFAALPLVTAAERHIAVRSLANLLRGRAARVQHAVVRAGAVLGLAFIAALVFDQARALDAAGTLTDFLDLPMAPAIYAFAVLAAAAALAALALFAKRPPTLSLPLKGGGDEAGPE
jgi:TRAP-type C4-dicarboxylate transport system permease small subunit